MHPPRGRRDTDTAMKVLLVDDEAAHMEWLVAQLGRSGVELRRLADPQDVEKALAADPPDVVLLDLHFPGDGPGATTGESLRTALRVRYPYLPVVAFTTRLADGAFPDPDLGEDTALFSKSVLPQGVDDLARALVLAHGRADLRRQLDEDQDALRLRLGFVVGQSAAMRRLVLELPRLSVATTHLLLVGPPGTPKEPVARALHQFSTRARAPFVVHAAGPPTTEVAADLFGTPDSGGQWRPGALERAERGTLFVEEVALLPIAVRQRLFEALESRQIPLAGEIQRRVDVRLIAASSDDETVQATGRVLAGRTLPTLRLPALSERADDLPALFAAAVAKANRTQGSALTPILRPSTLEKLRSHSWPGNDRELEELVAGIASRIDANVILPEHVVFATPPPGSGAAAREAVSVSGIAERILKAHPGERYEIAKQIKNPLRRQVLDRVREAAMNAGDLGGSEKEFVLYLAGDLDLSTYNRVRRALWEARRSSGRQPS